MSNTDFLLLQWAHKIKFLWAVIEWGAHLPFWALMSLIVILFVGGVVSAIFLLAALTPLSREEEIMRVDFFRNYPR